MEKKLVNFRLGKNTMDLLERLSKKERVTKTAIIEEAVIELALKKNVIRNRLIKYAGILTDEEAEIFYDVVRSRTSKPIIEL